MRALPYFATLVLAIAAAAVLIMHIPQHPAPSPALPVRSCAGNLCVQALPGGLVRVSNRAGEVQVVWWTR